MIDPSNYWEDILSFLGINTVAGTLQSIMSPEYRSLAGLVTACVMANFVGVIVGMAIWDVEMFTKMQKGSIIVTSGFIAPYILLGLLRAAKAFSEKPIKVIFDIILRRG